MRTFSREHKPAPRANVVSPTTPRSSLFGQSHAVSQLLHLQRAVGNQAVQGILRSATQDAGVVSSEATAPHFAHGSSRTSTPPSILQEVTRSTGQPLNRNTRGVMESRFGRDLSKVRIHTDSFAKEASLALGARAFTVGHDIFFRRASEDPNTTGGTGLLTHELAHTIQQSGRHSQRNAVETAPADLREQEADAAAQSVMSGGRASLQPHAASPGLQMQEEEEGATEANSLEVQARDRYIQLAEEKIVEIQGAVENGRIWPFEDEDLLLASELLEAPGEGLGPPEGFRELREDVGVGPGRENRIERRLDVLAHVICNLRGLISDLQNGTIQHVLPRSPSDFNLFYMDYIFAHGWGTEIIDWAGPIADTAAEFPFVEESPASTPVLRPAELPWWTCGPSQGPQREVPRLPSPVPIRVTDFWVHIPDPMRHPSTVDDLERGAPSSSLYLGPPSAAGVSVERRGESFPLQREGGLFFYMLGDRRINLPDLTDRFPDLLE